MKEVKKMLKMKKATVAILATTGLTGILIGLYVFVNVCVGPFAWSNAQVYLEGLSLQPIAIAMNASQRIEAHFISVLSEIRNNQI